jgi:predicted TIM-barrel fold metal-dependent hydrolase
MGEPDRLVVDVDAHYYESPRGFARYLEEPWKTIIESWTGAYYTPVTSGVVSDNLVGGRIKRVQPVGRPNTPEAIRSAMAELGTDVAVLLPNIMLHLSALKDRRVAVALANGFVDHMLDGVVNPKDGVYTLVVVPNQDPAAAAALIDRVAGEPGVCGVVAEPHGLALPLGDPYYDAIYQACLRHDLPFVLHSVGQGPWDLQPHIEGNLGFVLNAQIQLTDILMQGVPERFPGLRLVFEEAGVFWIAQMMYRLDTIYSMARSQAPLLRRPPSEYMRSFFYTTQPLERAPMRHLEYVFEIIHGSECLLYSSDWPHRDFDSPGAVERLSFLDEDGRRAILGGNARRAMRFRDLGRGRAQPGLQAGAARQPV